MSIGKRAALSILALALVVMGGSGDKRPVAAVIEMESRLVGETVDTRTMTDLFEAGLAEAGAYDIVSRSSLDAILSEQEFQMSGMTASQAAKIGALAGATKVVLLSLSRLGSAYVLVAKCVDSTTGILDVASTVSAPSLDGIVALTPELAFRLSGKSVAAPVTASAPAVPATAVPAATAPATATSPTGKPVASIGAAFDGSILAASASASNTLNEVVFEGLRRLAERYRGAIRDDPAGVTYGTGIDIAYREAGEGLSRLDALRSLAREGRSPIIAAGFTFGEDLTVAAKEFPATRFVILDWTVAEPEKYPNITYLGFREHEGTFLAGALSALVAKKVPGGVVGFIGGMDIGVIRRFRAGYVAGLATVDPAYAREPLYLEAFVGSFDDPARAEELAMTMYKGGARIIFQAAGRSGAGVFRAARRNMLPAIGVDVDQGLDHATSTVPEELMVSSLIMTSVVKRYDLAIERAVSTWIEKGSLPASIILGIADDGMELAVNAYNKDVLRPYLPDIWAIIKKVTSNDFKVPFDDETLKAFLSKRK